MKLLSYILFLIGFLSLSYAGYLLWQKESPNYLASHQHVYTQSEKKLITTKNLPVKITISDVGISLPIIPAKLLDSGWETTTEGASYAVSSPIPGETGNSIIYAHNWISLFGKLVGVKQGDRVEIEYADKTTKTFAIAYTLKVSPGDESILKSSNDKRITLYTCTDFLDSKRFVAVAFLQK